jgi:S-adenosylmethionine decarboxylase
MKKRTNTCHITFDAFDVDKKLLDDEEFILKLILEIPKLINMKIMSGPNLIRDYKKGHEGLTGFAIINFSHISIHTFIKTKECFIDIFSCKKFDYEKIRNFLYKKLKVKKTKVQTTEVRHFHPSGYPKAGKAR